MSKPNDDLPEHVVTEVVTLVRTWRVRAVDLSDAKSRIETRHLRGWDCTSPPERAAPSRVVRQWSGARARK